MSDDNRPVLKAKKPESKEEGTENAPAKKAPSAKAPSRGPQNGKEALSATDLKKDITEAADELKESLDVWDKNRSSIKEAGALRDSLHDIRRVIARVEIQIAYAERDHQSEMPVQHPRHRSKSHGN